MDNGFNFEERTLSLHFDNNAQALAFKEWLCGQGEQALNDHMANSAQPTLKIDYWQREDILMENNSDD